MNVHENGVKMLLESEGFAVFRSGWPDFLAVRGDQIIGVEHKSFDGELGPSQIAMRPALERVLPIHVLRTGRPCWEDGGFFFYNEHRALLDGFPWDDPKHLQTAWRKNGRVLAAICRGSFEPRMTPSEAVANFAGC